MSDGKVVLKMVMSLDGFATSPDGTHGWKFEWFGDDSGEWNLRALDEAGVHAMGRRSYEIMGPHWSTSEGPIATAMNEKPKAVFSHTLKKAEWGPAEIFGGDLGAEIAALKARDDQGTVLVHGGPDFAKSLTRLGLVDEYQLTTVPIAIGAGHSPFAARAPLRKRSSSTTSSFRCSSSSEVQKRAAKRHRAALSPSRARWRAPRR